MAQHTPGPWVAIEEEGDWWRVILADDNEAMVADYVTQQDARLIAAAPDLLEAMQAIMTTRWSPAGISEENADRARAAIAKATGEAV